MEAEAEALEIFFTKWKRKRFQNAVDKLGGQMSNCFNSKENWYLCSHDTRVWISVDYSNRIRIRDHLRKVMHGTAYNMLVLSFFRDEYNIIII